MYVRSQNNLYFTFNDEEIKEASFVNQRELDYIIEALNKFSLDDELMRTLGFESSWKICPDCFKEYEDINGKKNRLNCKHCGSSNHVVPFGGEINYKNYPFTFRDNILICREREIAEFERRRTCEYTAARLNKMIEEGKIVDLI